jgi:ABC-type molybdate transport system ATPase subunit
MSDFAEKVLWVESKAKVILTSKILVGNVTEDSDWQDVYYSFPEYQLYNKRNFQTNMKNLMKLLMKKEDQAVFEKSAVEHDLDRHPQKKSRGYPFCHLSEANIDNGIHEALSVEDF